MRFLCSFLVLFFIVQLSWCQYQNNDTIISFSLKDVSTNIAFELNEVEEDFVLLIFVSNHCPFVDQYISRIKLIDSMYSDVKVVLVNAFLDIHVLENQENMVAFLQKNNLEMVYVKDYNRELLLGFEVEKAPEVYLLAKVNHVFRLVYKGAIDDSPQTARDVKNQYLKNAIEVSRNNVDKSNSGTRSIGCRIK